MEEITKHIRGNECERCTCREAHPRKQKENEERYTKEDGCTLTIKEPDIAKGLTENNQHILLYTKINVKCSLSNEYLVM